MQPQPVTGTSFNVVDSFTRPADTTQYAANDAMGNSTTAAQIIPLVFPIGRINGGTFGLQRARLVTLGGASITAASFRLYLWTVPPVPASGDNATMTIPPCFSAYGYMGYIDITCDVVHSDGLSGFTNVAWIGKCAPNRKSLYGLGQATSTYTPTSGQKFMWTLEGIVD